MASPIQRIAPLLARFDCGATDQDRAEKAVRAVGVGRDAQEAAPGGSRAELLAQQLARWSHREVRPALQEALHHRLILLGEYAARPVDQAAARLDELSEPGE